MPTRPDSAVASIIAPTNVPSLRRPLGPASVDHQCRQHVGRDDAGRDRILEVVAHVGDAVGPRHDLTFRRAGCGTAPRVVAHAVERLGAQVQREQCDIGAPHGVVVPLGDVGRQGVLAGVPAGAVAAVVPEGDGLGERHVETERLADGTSDLGDLERVREAGALVVVGEHEHLRLAGEAAEGVGVQDPVAVALEAGPEGIWLLFDDAIASARRACGERRQVIFVMLLPRRPTERGRRAGPGPRILVGEPHVAHGVTAHGRRPPFRSLLRGQGGGHVTHNSTLRSGCATPPLSTSPLRPVCFR